MGMVVTSLALGILAFICHWVWRCRRYYAGITDGSIANMQAYIWGLKSLATDSTVTNQTLLNIGSLLNRGGKEGPLCGWVGPVPRLFALDAVTAQKVLTSPNVNKSQEYGAMEPLWGQGLITKCQAVEFVAKVDAEAGKGAPFDIVPLVKAAVLETIFQTIFGESTHLETRPFTEATATVHYLVRQRMQAPWFWPDSLYRAFGRGKEMHEAAGVCREFANKYLDREWDAAVKKRQEAKPEATITAEGVNEGKKPAKRKVFLNLLVDLALEGKFPKEKIIDELNTFINAGHETTTMGISFGLWLLAQAENQAAQERLIAEIDAELPEDITTVTQDKFKDLPYLDQVCKETLRLYPPGPVIGRLTTERLLDLGEGYKVPAGTNVGIGIYAIHRDPRHWPRPEIFDPDRFLPERVQARHPFAYIPFSAGPRNCIGQKFAYLEMKVMLAAVLQKYRVSTTLRRFDVLLKAELVMHADELPMLFTPRVRE